MIRRSHKCLFKLKQDKFKSDFVLTMPLLFLCNHNLEGAPMFPLTTNVLLHCRICPPTQVIEAKLECWNPGFFGSQLVTFEYRWRILKHPHPLFLCKPSHPTRRSVPPVHFLNWIQRYLKWWLFSWYGCKNKAHVTRETEPCMDRDVHVRCKQGWFREWFQIGTGSNFQRTVVGHITIYIYFKMI